MRATDEEEVRSARLFASGKITECVWDMLWEEWQDKRRSIHENLTMLERENTAHISNLDEALTIISKLDILYNKLERTSKRELLREIIDKIVVDRAGNIVRIELLPPFGYLKRLSDRVQQEQSSGKSRIKNSGTFTAASKRSDCATSGGPEGLSSVN